MTLQPGETVCRPYPFVRTTYVERDEEGSGERPSWMPGTRPKDRYPDNCVSVADAMGTVAYTVVSRHKPGVRYPERVFYTRSWTDPDGRTFGKPKLRMATVSALARLCHGYRYEFEMAKECEVSHG